MANEFIARNGVISRGNVVVTGSLTTSGSLTATGTITATTLVVQTVTSSISSITGSTNFGSLSSNTHTFTGSILTSGSTAYFAGNVGIGTSSPNQSLSIAYSDGGAQTTIYNTSTGHSVFANNTADKDINYQVSGAGSHYFRTAGIDILSILSTGHLKLTSTSGGGTNLDMYLTENDGLYINSNEGATSRAIYLQTGGTTRATISSTGISAAIYTATDRFIISANAGYRVNNNTDGVLGYMLRSGVWKGDSENNLGFATDGAYGISFFTNGSTTHRMLIYYDGYIALNSVVYGTTTSGTVRTLYIGNSNYLIGGISSIRASKKNIENVSNVDWLYQLNPVTFNYRKQDKNKNYTEEVYNELNYGLIAEDTQPIADFLINYNDKEDGTKEMIGIEYPRLITPMLKAIQEQNALITDLRTEIEELKARI